MDLSTIPPATQGKRNQEFFKLASWARSRVPEREWAATCDELRAWASRCSPPLETKEVDSALRSVEKYECGSKAVNRRDSSDGGLEISADAMPDFPIDAFPQAVQDVVRATAEHAQVPIDMPAMLALGTAAAAAAKTCRISPFPGWIEPLNLFVCVVMPPGSRKSLVFKLMLGPLNEHEQEIVATYNLGLAEVRTRARWVEAQEKKVWAQIESGKGDPDTLHDEALTRAEEVAEAKVPPVPRIFCDDVTPEKITSLLAENGGRLCCASPEADIFEIMRGRYSKSINIGVFLKAHAGDDIRVDRMSRESQTVQEPALSLILAVQPRAIQDLDKNGEMRGRGLLARFLFAIPESNVGNRAVQTRAITKEVMAAYTNCIKNIATAPIGAESPVMTMRPEAIESVYAYMSDIEKRLGENGDLNAVTEWGSKLAGVALRVAGLLHLMDGLGRDVPVHQCYVIQAVRICDYLVAHANLAHRMVKGGMLEAIAVKRILQRLLTFGGGAFDARDVYKNLYRNLSAKDVKQMLSDMCDRGWIAEAEIPAGGRSPRYTVCLPQTLIERLIRRRSYDA